jgi:hypothetical protein
MPAFVALLHSTAQRLRTDHTYLVHRSLISLSRHMRGLCGGAMTLHEVALLGTG